MSLSVITTFHKSGYELYGKKMINSFLQQWPKEIKLYVYHEDCIVDESADNLIKFDLHSTCTDLVVFKNRWKGIPKANGDVSADPVRSQRKDAGKGFKWDAVRFSNKVYAVYNCSKICDTDWLVWMDADNYCHSPISTNELENFFPKNRDLCYLGRKNKFSECGLYGINLRSQSALKFLQDFVDHYNHAEQGIFLMDEWHDSFVFDEVRKKHQLSELNWSEGLVTGEGHPLINSAWGAYLDHLKGNRKHLGHSKKQDLLINRKEDYWAKIR